MSERLSLKDRKALLAESAGGFVIPLPQVPGMQRVHRTDSKEDGYSSSKSESNLMGNAGATHANPATSQSDRSLLSDSERSETQDSFSIEGDTFNAAAMSKPLMAARRRPSQVANLASMIPSENKLTAKDLAAFGDDGTSNKRPQDMALGSPPKALSVTEQWLADKLVQMERDFQTRITLLEQEAQILRDALVANNIPVPPKPVPPPASTASTPSFVTDKKTAAPQSMVSPASPMTKKMASSSQLPVAFQQQKSSGELSAASPKAIKREVDSESGSDRALGSPLLGAAKKTPASPRVVAPPPTSQEPEPRMIKKTSSGNPFEDMEETTVEANGTNEIAAVEKSDAKSQESAKEAPAADSSDVAPPDEDEDVDDDLKDML